MDHRFSKMTPAEIKDKASELGFELTGIAPITAFPETNFYQKWIERGFAGEMKYLERQTEAKMNPESILTGAKSIIVCAMNYHTNNKQTQSLPGNAWISRYAWGDDYHLVLGEKLKKLASWLHHSTGASAKAYVDTGPLLERVHAKYAGIGWFGKNTCIINEKLGSWFFLGCILTDLETDYDVPPPDRCGSCTRCIDACPTDALLEPYVLDSNRCISYLTIELRGEIPENLREGMGQHLFGCDICQDVCPWNRRAPVSTEPAFEPRQDLFHPALEHLLDLDENEWKKLIRKTALKRARVVGLMRNLMVVVGNSGLQHFRHKIKEFTSHSDKQVRSHARWALSRLNKGNR